MVVLGKLRGLLISLGRPLPELFTFRLSKDANKFRRQLAAQLSTVPWVTCLERFFLES